MAETLKEWALKYASMGFAVFPVKTKAKAPATPNGCKDATTDHMKIETWWTMCPDYNIGIATGSVSGGLVVIDLDIDEEKGKNGYEVFKQWQQEHGSFPETCQSITGRGGYHLLFRDSAQWGNRTGIYDGIDIRGEGGYIVAPPSLHESGRRYEWEQEPGEYEIAQVDNVVVDFLIGPPPKGWEKQGFEAPAEIPEGKRVSTLVALVGSLKSKGLADEAIRAAVAAENESRCIPALTDTELQKEVFPALQRDWKTTAPYHKAVCDNGRARPPKQHSLEMVPMAAVEEKCPEWLVVDYVPRYQITTLAGDGGSGKTTVWCAIAAAVSSGKPCFLTEGLLPDAFAGGEPGRVLFFSAEDSFEYTLKRRLRKNGANMDNIFSIDVADDRFQDIKFNSHFFEELLAKYRPTLVVLDPLQNFVPPDIQMGWRNAMRQCLNPLIGYGEKYGCTFLIIAHANKQSGVWGRKRIADSADIWDISRSVIMAGETNDAGIRYLSHEKSNYGMTGDTVLYKIEDEVVRFMGYSTKKDRDFITEVDYTTRQAPAREEAKEFILDFLKDGEKEVSELDEMAKAMSISDSTLKRAKADLKKDGKIKYRPVTQGRGQGFKYYVSLTASDEVT